MLNKVLFGRFYTILITLVCIGKYFTHSFSTFFTDKVATTQNFLQKIEELSKSNVLRRLKRDFMYASGASNDTDPLCFQSCNNAWKQSFEARFHINCSDFYDFPFHPKILDYANFVDYCDMADEQTKCFINKCKDESADRVFSPANFLCHFKRSQFSQARPCLEESEPLTFLKCDQQCHSKAVTEAVAGSAKERFKGDEQKKEDLIGSNQRADVGKVFSTSEMNNYEKELDLLCSFQECYKLCHESIINQVCATGLADMALDLVATYVQWHAADVYDWHLVTENLDSLPASCVRLTHNNGQQQQQLEGKHKDPVLKLMKNMS